MFSKEKDKELERRLHLEQFHLDSLKILRQIDKIAKDNGIIYSTDSGTLLGHIRHNGFIPWDDDADIIMTRENFDKFVIAWEKDNKDENLRMMTPYFFNNRFLDMIYKIADFSKNYKQSETFKNYPELSHPRVDVFVLDNVPSNRIRFRLHTFRLKVLYAFASSRIDYKNPIKRPLIERLGLNFFKTIGYMIPLKHSISRFEKVAKKYNKKSCEYCHNSSFMITLDVAFKKAWYNTSSYKAFEDTKLQYTNNYHEVLSLLYGKDYMIPKIDYAAFKRHFDSTNINTSDVLSHYQE